MTAPCPIFGFELDLAIEPRLSETDAERLWRELNALLDRRGLEARGIRSTSTWSYRIRGESSQATDVDRTAIQEWATTQRGIVSCRTSVIFDLAAEPIR